MRIFTGFFCLQSEIDDGICYNIIKSKKTETELTDD